MLHKIFFVAGLVGCAGHQFSQCHIKIAGKRQSAMPDIFELTPLYFTWLHRQPRMFAFQCLYPGHFIQTFRALSLLCPFRCLFVGIVNINNFFIKTCFIGGCQPIAAQVRLDITLFLKAWPHAVPKYAQLSCVSSLRLRFRARSTG